MSEAPISAKPPKSPAHRWSNGPGFCRAQVGLLHDREIERVRDVVDLDVEARNAVLLCLGQLVTHVRGHVGPTFFQLHLPISARRALCVLTHQVWHLVLVVLATVDHCVLWVYLALIEKDKLLVRPDLLLPVANDAIVATSLGLSDVVTCFRNDVGFSNQATADQHGHQARISAALVVPGVLVALRHTLREVNAEAEHRARGLTRVVQGEARLQDAHGRRGVRAMGEQGLAGAQPVREVAALGCLCGLRFDRCAARVGVAHLGESPVELRVLAAEGMYHLQAIGHLLRVPKLKLEDPVAREHPLEGVVEHALQGIDLSRLARRGGIHLSQADDLLALPIVWQGQAWELRPT
mmetsp:Transcript_151931/g.487626  ORF Transcript_151931/g.487626 Transcript_151931/m.487626 type:complete len:351 (-) Transcript_151931:1790-2842(-)